jgi:tartrate-resistant acid phosphatase type 5
MRILPWLPLVAACSDAGSGKPDAPAPVAPQVGTVRFVALGDAGTGEDGQALVAAAMATVCQDLGCDFVLYLGDNIYDSGADSVDDVQFQDKFEQPYSELDLPFYVTLGNHDYGGGGLGNERDKAEPQVLYTEHSDKWTMPDRTYAVDHAHTRLMSLDTNAILWGNAWETLEPQQEWIQETLGTDHRWKIAFGHHPYISNGEHGSAGKYEGIEDIPIVSGQELKDFFEDNLCGQVDLYISGHDHDLQWLEPQCGTHFMVSGAGGKTRSIEGWDQPTRFELGDTLGFHWIEISDDKLSAKIFNSDAELLYEDTIQKD